MATVDVAAMNTGVRALGTSIGVDLATRSVTLEAVHQVKLELIITSPPRAASRKIEFQPAPTKHQQETQTDLAVTQEKPQAQQSHPETRGVSQCRRTQGHSWWRACRCQMCPQTKPPSAKLDGEGEKRVCDPKHMIASREWMGTVQRPGRAPLQMVWTGWKPRAKIPTREVLLSSSDCGGLNTRIPALARGGDGCQHPGEVASGRGGTARGQVRRRPCGGSTTQ